MLDPVYAVKHPSQTISASSFSLSIFLSLIDNGFLGSSSHCTSSSMNPCIYTAPEWSMIVANSFPGFGLRTLPTICRYIPKDFVGLASTHTSAGGQSNPSVKTIQLQITCIDPLLNSLRTLSRSSFSVLPSMWAALTPMSTKDSARFILCATDVANTIVFLPLAIFFHEEITSLIILGLSIRSASWTEL